MKRTTLAPKARYTLTLQAPDSGDSAIRRLRAALKCLLRAFGLRCIRVVEDHAPRTPARPPARMPRLCPTTPQCEPPDAMHRWREGFAGRHVPALERDAVSCRDHVAAEPAPEPWQPQSTTPPVAGPSGDAFCLTAGGTVEGARRVARGSQMKTPPPPRSRVLPLEIGGGGLREQSSYKTLFLNLEMDPRDEIRALVDRLPRSAMAGLLASFVRLCPSCGVPGRIRTSRRLRVDSGRLCYFRCDACGHAWKGRVVSAQQTSVSTPKHVIG